MSRSEEAESRDSLDAWSESTQVRGVQLSTAKVYEQKR